MSHGKDTILVVVDRLSKYAHFMSLLHPFTTRVVVEKFVEGVVKLHGMPQSIVSDHDPFSLVNFGRNSLLCQAPNSSLARHITHKLMGSWKW